MSSSDIRSRRRQRLWLQIRRTRDVGRKSNMFDASHTWHYRGLSANTFSTPFFSRSTSPNAASAPSCLWQLLRAQRAKAAGNSTKASQCQASLEHHVYFLKAATLQFRKEEVTADQRYEAHASCEDESISKFRNEEDRERPRTVNETDFSLQTCTRAFQEVWERERYYESMSY